MIKHLIFFRGGNVWASDESGNQVAEEQEAAWWTVIQDKLARGVIDDTTLVTREHYSDLTVAEIVRLRRGTTGELVPERERRVVNQTIFQPGPRGEPPRHRTGEIGKEVKELNEKHLKIEINGEVGADALPTEIARYQERFQTLVAELKNKCG